jgi:hypothetical protein
MPNPVTLQKVLKIPICTDRFPRPRLCTTIAQRVSMGWMKATTAKMEKIGQIGSHFPPRIRRTIGRALTTRKAVRGMAAKAITRTT